jgi:uncharacterized membrane protein
VSVKARFADDAPRFDTRMVGCCGALLIIALGLQLVLYHHGGHQSVSDIPRIVLGRHFERGTVPYIDRLVEYPVLAGGLLAVAVSVWPSPSGALVVTAVGAGSVALVVTVLLGRRFGTRAWRWALAPPLVLYAFQNWDVFAIGALVVALVAYDRGRDGAAGVALGVGGAVKLFPLVVVVPLAALRWAHGDRRGARRLGVGALGAFAALNLPVLLADARAWWWTYQFQSARQATWGSAWFYLFRLGGLPVHGARGAQLANAVAAVALVAGVAWLVVVAIRRDLDPCAAAGAAVAIFLLCNKVYSPTYDLWLVVFFVMVPLGTGLWVTFCLIDVAVFVAVYGYFDGPLTVDTVRAVLPALVILRTAALLVVVARATEVHRASPIAIPIVEGTGSR